MIFIDGVQYPSHKEYFQRFPWKAARNKKINEPLLMAEYNKPCPDCKLRWHAAVMTLDHLDRDGYKNSNGVRRFPSGMTGYPPELFKAELSKCEAVCANCHVVREMIRDGHIHSKKWEPYGDKALMEQNNEA